MTPTGFTFHRRSRRITNVTHVHHVHVTHVHHHHYIAKLTGKAVKQLRKDSLADLIRDSFKSAQCSECGVLGDIHRPYCQKNLVKLPRDWKRMTPE